MQAVEAEAKSMNDSMAVPKRSCPRDHGFWYCETCKEKHLSEQSEVDFVLPIVGCGKQWEGKICGNTHLGFSWCEDCITANRLKHHHIGEYEIVATVEGKA